MAEDTVPRMAIDRLAVLGGEPAFPEPLHVGRPNVGDIGRLRTRFDQILECRWFTNNGPFVQEFEAALQDRLGSITWSPCATARSGWRLPPVRQGWTVRSSSPRLHSSQQRMPSSGRA